MSSLSPAATEAVRIILNLRKCPTTQTPIAERKILAKLSVQDYIDAVAALEDGGKQ